MTDTLEIKIGDNEVKIVMYQGILNKIIRECNGTVEALLTDVTVQEKCIEILSNEYDEKGKVKGQSFSPFTLTSEQTAELIAFIVENFSDFLLKTAKVTEQKLAPIAKEMQKIQDLALTARG